MKKNKSELWNDKAEIRFFSNALENFASVEQLFYRLYDGYYAYIPKGYTSENQTLQSRNSLIGQYTEKWCRDLLNPIAKKMNLYAVNGVVCEALGLSRQSNADLAFCTTKETNQKPENIKLLFEIKMSIVSNYKYTESNKIQHISDFTKHKGIPSLLRSDSMLKAIGKSVNIRVSGIEACKIPIIVLGNSPITENYIKKVDFLRQSGVIQAFWSLNPKPSNNNFLECSPNKGFDTIFDSDQLFSYCYELIKSENIYFSSMLTKNRLGEIIKIASREKEIVKCADKFLSLIQGK